MSIYGIKIQNYEAASIYERQYGFRQHLDKTDAMLINSLFKDFLVENGLKVSKNESTRDIICVQFGYKTKGYAELKAKAKRLNSEILMENIEKNKDKCVEVGKNELRTLFYTEGCEINYGKETIRYRMLYRTPGKAKKGNCMFIRESLYEKAHNFLYMGIELPYEKAPIVEIGAYASLITSSIVGKIKINPEEILVLKDVKTSAVADVVRVYADENNCCRASHEKDYEMENEIFDGQALIDSSIFPEWGDGYVLLRHHMTKCAAFSANIQTFMMDYFGDKYETATVTDMFGNTLLAKNIKLITTNNAIKFLKFGVSYDYWLEWIKKNDCMFGVVKTSHPSKLGNVQRMSYQMVNSLEIDSMPEVTSRSMDYITKLKTDDNVFVDYLEKNKNFSNDFEALVALVKHNQNFVRCDYFRRRKSEIIRAYILNFKSGRCIQNADNLTIVGSPYAMLLHSVGEDIYKDPTFTLEEGTIQCYTKRFNDGQYLAEFRNPFNSRNNLGYMHNTYHPYFEKYFNLGRLCVAVNMINTVFQQRNNGSDQDSDSIYTTDQVDIVMHAKRCFREYPTIVNDIQPEKNIYNNTMESYAKIDNALTAAQLAIGESSNLAQLCLTYTYNFDDEKYSDYVCILAVLAQIAIDNAKRKFSIDLETEIPRIKKELNINEVGLPKFWLLTKKDKRKANTDAERNERDAANKEMIKKKINEDLICPMNYLYDIDFKQYRSSESTIPFGDFLIPQEGKVSQRKSKRVEELIKKYSIDIHDFKINMLAINWEEEKEEMFVIENSFSELIEDIKKIYISHNYASLMYYLLRRAFHLTIKNLAITDLDKNRPALLSVLYNSNPEVFLSCFKNA